MKGNRGFLGGQYQAQLFFIWWEGTPQVFSSRPTLTEKLPTPKLLLHAEFRLLDLVNLEEFKKPEWHRQMDVFQSWPPDPRKCFLRRADQSQSAPSHRLQPTSLPCSRWRVIPGNTAESYSLFNILLGGGIIFTPWQIVAPSLGVIFAPVCPNSFPVITFQGYFGYLRRLHLILAQPSCRRTHDFRWEFLPIESTTKWFHGGCGSRWSEPSWTLRLHTFVLPWACFWKLCFLVCSVQLMQRIHCTVGKPESDCAHILSLLKLWRMTQCAGYTNLVKGLCSKTLCTK